MDHANSDTAYVISNRLMLTESSRARVQAENNEKKRAEQALNGRSSQFFQLQGTLQKCVGERARAQGNNNQC